MQRALHLQKFSIPKLFVKSSDPKLNLRLALGAAGMPLEIRGDVECDKPLTAAHVDVLQGALRVIAPESAPAGTLNWPAVSRLMVNGGLKAPSVVVDGFEMGTFEARNAALRDLKLSVPSFGASILGGRLKLEDAEYDFSKMATKGNGNAMKGVRHSQRLHFSDGDLCQLLGGEKPDPVRYALCGKLSAQGPFNGIDFSGMDRLSWNGALKCEFESFSIGAPIVVADNAVAPLPWMDYFKYHAGGRGTVLARATSTDTVAALEMSVTGASVSSPAANAFDGFLACAELYFAKVYGVESVRMEFETFTPTVRIDKGLAVFEPFELKGKGACAGFDIQIRNVKINLADETFADETLVYPLALPKDAQDRLSLQKWPTLTRQLFLTSMSAGRMPLRISGPLAAPTIKFPWTESSAMARTALFGVEAIPDAESLAKAREHLQRMWGKDDASLEAAAQLADRMGAGLPGTLSSRLTRETIVDHATKLPPKILAAAALTAAQKVESPLLSPLESLKNLLFAEPEVPLPPTPPVPVVPGAPDPLAPAPVPAPAVKLDKNATPVRNGKSQ